MTKVEIINGGKMGDFGNGGKLSSIRFTPSDTGTKNIQLYLETSEGEDNLSYLSLDEAVELKAELEKAITETIDNYSK